MAIIYYPNRVYKGVVPAIDRVMAIRKPISATGSQSIASTALNVVISNNSNWQVDSVGLQFSNAAARDFSATIMNGRNVVQNLNDALWITVDSAVPQSIVLTPGFYTGTQLATQLQTQLNANVAFTALGRTFTVTYNSTTGIYTITPNVGKVQYLNVNPSQTLRTRDSIAGHLFGFTVTTTLATSISSDTAVFGLNSEMGFITQTASTALSYLHTDIHTMTVDQAVHLTSNVGANVTVDYIVDYETII